MKIETREIYKCDHCNKLYQRKHAAINHEKACPKNPKNFRKCLDWCKHLRKKDATIEIDYLDSSCARTYSLFYCNAKKHFLYTPQNEYKGNFLELEGNDNLPMPKDCQEYK